MVLSLPVLSVPVMPVPALAQSAHTHQHSFEGAEKWAQVFDDPERDAWQRPHEVIAALGLAPDAVVADIGAGTGYFSVRLAHFLPRGHVYAVDTEPDMVKYLQERAQREKLARMTAVAAAADDPRLPEKVDLVLMVDVFHHIEDRPQYLKRLRSYLRPHARVAVVDFNQASRMGPPPAARIAPERVRSDFEQAGYKLLQRPDILKEQYFMVFGL